MDNYRSTQNIRISDVKSTALEVSKFHLNGFDYF